ncbi:MAG: LLM class F420-dependent oxidoreductase [Myxococcota bacterium]|nr:LLM class F420-dependent oxidoreductase [Myxococcota bacterium]
MTASRSSYTRLALQIPNFDLPGVEDADLFASLVQQARAAEEAGFDTVFVMDHFYQLPMLGPPENRMLEAYTLLGALAGQTDSLRLGTLVTGNTYRNPALLAKIVTTLDVVSRGRAVCGVGAGWFEPEHRGYGFAFGTLGERLDKLEEALQILGPMFRGERPSFEGRHFHTHEALNVPAPIQAGGIPILIGGNGERRTLRLVARYADESNLTCPLEEVPRKLDALARHCDELGRDRGEIHVSWLGSLILAKSHAEAEAARDAFFARRGLDFRGLPEGVKANVERLIVMGDPDTVCARIHELIATGLDGIVVNLPANGHEPEAIRLAGQVLGAALR